MRVLITIRRSPPHTYLINILTKAMIEEVRGLIAKQQYGKAIDLVYEKGMLEREITHHELPVLKADLILSAERASWDVMK